MKIWIIDLESVTSRYTCEWKTHIPELLKQHLKNSGEYHSSVEVIEGPSDIPPSTSPGAFLNFGGTNVYKSVQIEKLSRYFIANEVKNGDHILFTDAWHPGVIQVKYMAELLGIKVYLHALWHAGSYDSQDFLGRLIGDKPWVRFAEKSMFHCFDYNYFATEFHIQMFCENLLDEPNSRMYLNTKIIQTGWPMEYMEEMLKPYRNMTKKNLILFPHRIAPEKQLDIFNDLSLRMPEYEWVVCQHKNLTKTEYHQLLGQSKMVFSANLQETLGISMMEGMLVGSWPMVPDRLSYSEMYPSIYKYDSTWTSSWDSYRLNKENIIEYIRNVMNSHNPELIIKDSKPIFRKYFSSINLFRNLNKRVIHVDSMDTTMLKSKDKE
jgi:hypothetical protein